MGKTYQTVIINAPVEKVWKKIRNFHDMSWAPNVITKVEPTGNTPGVQVGAGRILNGIFRETLKEVNQEELSFTYSIDDGPSPLSSNEIENYVGRVKVSPSTDGKGTMVEWSSTWDKNDDQVYDFCHPMYMSLLDELKNNLE